MSDTLVVICTKNHQKYMVEAVKTARATSDADILVIDNGADASEKADADGLDIEYIWNPAGGYDSGAYKLAIDRYGDKYDWFFFTHDDVEFIRAGWVDECRTKMARPNVGCVAITTFANIWDSPLQQEFVAKMLGVPEIETYKHGIFGPIFFTSKEVLRRIKESGFLRFECRSKLDQQAMERGWGYMMEALGLRIETVARPLRALMDEAKCREDDCFLIHRVTIRP